MLVIERVKAALAGRYDVERELGAGGMATVYLARDEKHNRKVAVKVLRPEIAATLGAVRFSREIQVAAQLSHPHILPLLDSGEADHFFYYVMPYVEGDSLRERVARGGELPVHDAVKILCEVVDALAHAHAHGVVHRDIKPDNIMLSGRHALVTDFGVAKAVSEATGRHNLTTAGVALGTPAYMAPEQAAADPNLDHRVDIYAVGALAYELLTGRPPFHGMSPQEVLAAHVTRTPEPVDQVRPGMVPALGPIIMRCLAKRPSDRWQSSEELLAQLEPLLATTTGMTPTNTRPWTGVSIVRPRRAWAVGVGVALAAMLIITVIVATRGPAPVLQVGRRSQITLDPGLELDPAISPDGRLVAFASASGLSVRQVEGGAPIRVTRDALDRWPVWTPNGDRLLFMSRRGIEIVPALGGAPRLIHTPPRFEAGAAIAPDGGSFAYSAGDSVMVKPLEGGEARALAAGREIHSLAWSRDGRWLAWVAGNSQFVDGSLGNIAPSTLWVVRASGGTPQRVTDERWLNVSPTWAPDGSLLFISNRDGGRDVYQLALTRRGAAAGEPARLTTGLSAHSISVSADGRRFAYSAFTERSNVWSVAIPAGGAPASIAQARPLTSGSQTIESFDISPDGRWLVFDSDRGGTQQLFRMPLAGGDVEQLTTDSANVFFPDYSPDGRELVFHGFRDGRRVLFVMPSEGGTPVRITMGPDDERAATWAPDGRHVLSLANFGASRRPSFHIVERNADGTWEAPRQLPVLVGADSVGAGIGMWSPDGRFIAANSQAKGLVVVPASGGQARVLAGAVPNSVVGYIDWSPDGRRIYYLLTDSTGMTLREIPVTGGAYRVVVRFDDPTRPWHRFGLRVRAGRAYFTLGELESDVYVAELGARR